MEKVNIIHCMKILVWNSLWQCFNGFFPQGIHENSLAGIGDQNSFRLPEALLASSSKTVDAKTGIAIKQFVKMTVLKFKGLSGQLMLPVRYQSLIKNYIIK